ncbi:hypothetical protein [Cellulomonas sp. ATA003]|nr:hypothetical protein [Cellulomonas sp. ATA003]WNB84947.1 hypothetical protein REH70_14755 [Cellulomonas sp. ATA003]
MSPSSLLPAARRTQVPDADVLHADARGPRGGRTPRWAGAAGVTG